MIEILLSYYQKNPFLFDFLNFLRDIFLFLQILIVIFVIINYQKNKYFAIYYLLIFVFAFVVETFFKNFFPSPRPIGGLDSFPSTHTLVSTALSLGLFIQNLQLGIFSGVLTLLIAILSILSLRHWLIDILFGFLFGFLIFFVLQKLLNLFNRFNSNQ